MPNRLRHQVAWLLGLLLVMDFLVLQWALPVSLEFDDEDILDLSYPFNNQTVYHPAMEQLGFTFKLGSVTRRMNKQGQFYSMYQFEASEHGGTHVDAPSHNQLNGSSVDRIPLNQLIGPAIVLDISQQARRNSNYELGVEDLQQWEKRNGKIQKKSIILICSGWGRKWPNRNALYGTKNFPDGSDFHFPGLSPHAAKWLIDHRSPKAVGTDGPSLDSGSNQRELPVHQLFSRHNVAIIEFVANVDRLPAVGATVIGLPMKIQGGSAAPVRLIAVNWNSDHETEIPDEAVSVQHEYSLRKNSSRPFINTVLYTPAQLSSAKNGTKQRGMQSGLTLTRRTTPVPSSVSGNYGTSRHGRLDIVLSVFVLFCCTGRDLI